jgi:hypothetical protein
MGPPPAAIIEISWFFSFQRIFIGVHTLFESEKSGGLFSNCNVAERHGFSWKKGANCLSDKNSRFYGMKKIVEGIKKMRVQNNSASF